MGSEVWMAQVARSDPAGDERSDAALVAAAQGGDAGAVQALLVRYEGQIYRIGLRMCRDPEDAREVLQETLFAAARTLGEFRSEAAVGTWFYAIARSFCIKMRRRGGRAASSGEAGDDEAARVPDPGRLPDEAAADGEVGAALRRAIDELAEGYREVLVLRDVEGLTASEVATVLGIGVAAVKSRLHRARLTLRDKLAPILDAGVPAPAQEGCPDVLGLFSQRLEGEVDADLCRELESHVARCERCSAACDSLKHTLTLCKTAGNSRAVVPPDVQASVRRAVREMLRLDPG
jgi:RNA polymerase sigma-70 factor (ECF subfamily)